MTQNSDSKIELGILEKPYRHKRKNRYGNCFSVETLVRRFPRDKNCLSEIRSTLLIPEKYYETFLKRVLAHNGIRSYVSYLLSRYKIHIVNGLVPPYKNHTTKYQEKNQNLVKVAFRPDLDDWAELKLYRVSFGMSISLFLVYLLMADFVDFAENASHLLAAVGISQTLVLDLCAKVFLSRKNSIYTTIFQYRHSPDG